MNTIKYYLVHFELLVLMFSVIIGIGAAESCEWLQAYAFIFGPFVYGKVIGMSKHLEFCEAYDRAYRIKYNINKTK